MAATAATRPGWRWTSPESAIPTGRRDPIRRGRASSALPTAVADGRSPAAWAGPRRASPGRRLASGAAGTPGRNIVAGGGPGPVRVVGHHIRGKRAGQGSFVIRSGPACSALYIKRRMCGSGAMRLARRAPHPLPLARRLPGSARYRYLPSAEGSASSATRVRVRVSRRVSPLPARSRCRSGALSLVVGLGTTKTRDRPLLWAVSGHTMK